MPAAKHDLNVDRGSTFKLFLEYQTAGTTGIDLDGYTANMQVRRHAEASEILLHFYGTTADRGLTVRSLILLVRVSLELVVST